MLEKFLTSPGEYMGQELKKKLKPETKRQDLVNRVLSSIEKRFTSTDHEQQVVIKATKIANFNNWPDNTDQDGIESMYHFTSL